MPLLATASSLARLRLRLMQRLVRFLVGRPRVAAAPFGQLDAA
jgi:hypothetical protein